MNVYQLLDELLKGLSDIEKAEMLEKFKKEIYNRLECLYGHNGG